MAKETRGRGKRILDQGYNIIEKIHKKENTIKLCITDIHSFIHITCVYLIKS
jgi:hypothetical protein